MRKTCVHCSLLNMSETPRHVSVKTFLRYIYISFFLLISQKSVDHTPTVSAGSSASEGLPGYHPTAHVLKQQIVLLTLFSFFPTSEELMFEMFFCQLICNDMFLPEGSPNPNPFFHVLFCFSSTEKSCF